LERQYRGGDRPRGLALARDRRALPPHLSRQPAVDSRQFRSAPSRCLVPTWWRDGLSTLDCRLLTRTVTKEADMAWLLYGATGYIDVFEAVFARDGEARSRGVALLPGVGFDVVPTDCLAGLLKRALPSARELELAFASTGGALSSAGTLKSSLEGLAAGGRVRRGGALTRVPIAHADRDIPFADKTRSAAAIPWGDIATAWRSTQIP